MIFLNEVEEGGVSHKEFESFLKLIAPFAPHITEELWHELGNKASIHSSMWPAYDPENNLRICLNSWSK